MARRPRLRYVRQLLARVAEGILSGTDVVIANGGDLHTDELGGDLSGLAELPTELLHRRMVRVAATSPPHSFEFAIGVARALI